MNQRALAQFYQEIIEDKLDLKTSLDESGHVVCKLPDLGCLIVCLLLRPCEVSSRIANPTILEVAHNALRVLLQHRHVLVGGLA